MTNKYTEAEMQEMLNERHSRAFMAWVEREHELALEEDRSRAAGKALLESASYASELAADLQAVKQKLHDELEAAKQRRLEAYQRELKLDLNLQEATAGRAKERMELNLKLREQQVALERAQAAARRLGAQNAVLKAMFAAVAKVEP